MEFHEYLRSYRNYFWQWEDEGDVTAIPNGNTIAYKELLYELLSNTAPQGIPPFGAALLFIIATNTSAPHDLLKVSEILYIAFHKHEREYRDAIHFLQLLSNVPERYKKGKLRVSLFQAVFQGCHNIINRKKAKRILDVYTSRRVGIGEIFEQQELNSAVLSRDMKLFSLLLQKYPTTEDILKKMHQLPVLDEMPELEQPTTDGNDISKDFIEMLQAQPQTFHVGALIKRIWSGLNIPLHNILPSEQPIGGVSDLSNKGELDRLLVSEFANDDLVLLSRLANNEALYFNREVPPQVNDMDRIILLDVSIKNWGTPKLIAFALMLAIAKHPKTDIHCVAFALGKDVYPVRFDTVHDIIDALHLVDECLFPEQGIEKFKEKSKAYKKKEVIFISAKDAIKTLAGQRMLADNHDLFNYWIFTDKDGNIDLYRKQHKAKKHIQHIQLPLEILWKKEIKEVMPAQEPIASNAFQYPILFALATKPRHTLFTENNENVYIITREKRLLQNTSGSQGWRMIHDSLNYIAGDSAIGRGKDGKLYVGISYVAQRKVNLFCIDTGKESSVILADGKISGPVSFIYFEDAFYWLEERRFRKIDPTAGTIETFENRPPSEYRKQLEMDVENKPKLLAGLQFSGEILKNINTVFINPNGAMFLNKHALLINRKNEIRLEELGFNEKKIVATMIDYCTFRFPDGSELINKNGLLILRPGFKDAYKVILKDAGLSKLHLIRFLKETSDYSLHTTKDFIDSIPSILLYGVSKEKAEAKVKEISVNCAEAKLCVEKIEENISIYIPTVLNKPLGVATDNYFSGNEFYRDGKEQKVMQPDVFWDLYIEAFINNIQRYGTAN